LGGLSEKLKEDALCEETGVTAEAEVPGEGKGARMSQGGTGGAWGNAAAPGSLRRKK